MALSKITYTDKETLNEQPSIADKNKVKSDDMNKIKRVVNAGIDQIDANTTNIGNITGTILWTNPDSTVNFSPQNIILNSSDYDMILWIIKIDVNTNVLITEYSIKGYGISVFNLTNNQDHRRRVITYTNDTTYAVGNSMGQDGLDHDGSIIPLYAIGYKTGLFN